MEIEYTTFVDPSTPDQYVDEETADQYGWREDEEAVASWLKTHISDQDQTTAIDLGLVVLELDKSTGGKTLVAYSKESLRLLELPPIDNAFDADAHDIRLPHLRNPLVACQILHTSGRADMSAHLYLVPNATETESSILPFLLRIEIEVSLVFPTIFAPVQHKTKCGANEVEEAQRRALLYMFPSRMLPIESFHGAVDIPLLYSVVGPAPRLHSDSTEEELQPEKLVPTLLPFQRRSAAWMLVREGKHVLESGGIVSKSSASEGLPLFWEEVQVDDDVRWYLNRLRGILSPERPEKNEALGGILAEEPGLGKTLECIAVVMLNPAVGRGPSVKRWDPEAKVHVKEIKTTLIVTPASLATQWADEFALHAPSLKVLVYEGWTKVPVPITPTDIAISRARRQQSKSKGRNVTAESQSNDKGKDKLLDVIEVDEDEVDNDDDLIDWCIHVNTFDVCITTYNVLQQDLDVARAPPTRPHRTNVRYHENVRTRSPLVVCEWYRVIMDEVQMGGGKKSEEMVSLIPRLSSFAVSGTPARAHVGDLIHVLKFLRVTDIDRPRSWLRLLKPGYVNEFVSLFRKYTVRTVKAAVKDELTIPRQTRFLVPIELGRVERHVYDQNMEKALLELGLDMRGVAVREGWEVNTSVLRTWLRKLRGICTHPQVGQLQNQADRLHKPGVLKTIGEVLEGMKDQNWRNLSDDRKEKIQVTTRIAQMLQRNDDNPTKYQNALDTLLSAEKEARQLIADIEDVITEHNKKGEILKEETKKLREARGQGVAERELAATPSSKGKGRARARSEDITMEDDTDSDDEDLPHNPAGEEHKTKKSALQHRLRECRIALHKALFLMGDVYHVLGVSFADKENEAYAAAEELRRLLLKSTENAAQRAMDHVNCSPTTKALKEEDLYIEVPYLGQGGIRSAALMEEANRIIEDLLNEQSALLWKWREKLISLLTKSLTSGEEAADGEEYARSLETQGEAEAYLQVYAALLADRREALMSERTLLDVHDVQETKKRKTRVAQRIAIMDLLHDVEEADFVPLEKLPEALPEHEVLYKELNDERKTLLEDFDSNRAIKSVMVDLNNVAARLPRQDDPEKILAKDGATELRGLIADQTKLMEKLRTDLAHLRKTFNERISYFRQLQEISDTVAEANWNGSVAVAIAVARGEQAALEAKINTGRARHRYLQYLAQSQEEGNVDEDQRACVLCRCEFTRGYITPCAHVFCEECLRAWLGRPEGKACPVCRVALKADQLQRFSLDQECEPVPEAPPRLVNNEPAPKSRRQIQYNLIDPKVFEEIQAVESLGSYGSKIQTLVRHLLYLETVEPGTKSIIFSAWADSLHIIQHALARNSISCIRIDQSHAKKSAAKKFRDDPNISVLLLHGERENAGLNVTCASRVFLVESVVHHAFELQAIARIDRMGQTRPTEVYCYYAEETVERNILDLAARQGQSLYTKDNSGGTVNVTPFAMASSEDKTVIDSPAKRGQKGDFVFKTDDMLAIFFPHLFEEVEYLLPPEDLSDSIAGEQVEDAVRHPAVSVNAEAGPSRLVD
ncbi:SNF2 family N-terminal domain-containing protein [Sparassis latifolia]